MMSNKKAGRVSGVLLLLVFIIGVSIYQFLRGPIVFGDDYLTQAALQSHRLIASVLLAFVGGTLSILIAVILLPAFRRHSTTLAHLYVAFCILNFLAIALENQGVLALMELSRGWAGNGTENRALLNSMGDVFYGTHRWSHYTYLLISCLPVFVLYHALFVSRLVPRWISMFGMVAVVLMLTEVVMTFFDLSTPVNLLIPMGLVQLFLPLWLIVRGLDN